jgi:hypothetical protein
VGEVKFKVQSLRPFAVPAGHRQETKGSKFKIKRGVWGDKGTRKRFLKFDFCRLECGLAFAFDF